MTHRSGLYGHLPRLFGQSSGCRTPYPPWSLSRPGRAPYDEHGDDDQGSVLVPMDSHSARRPEDVLLGRPVMPRSRSSTAR